LIPVIANRQRLLRKQKHDSIDKEMDGRTD